MSGDIVQKLLDLHKQATMERSHYYVASCCREAIAEIMGLRTTLALLQGRRTERETRKHPSAGLENRKRRPRKSLK